MARCQAFLGLFLWLQLLKVSTMTSAATSSRCTSYESTIAAVERLGCDLWVDAKNNTPVETKSYSYRIACGDSGQVSPGNILSQVASLDSAECVTELLIDRGVVSNITEELHKMAELDKLTLRHLRIQNMADDAVSSLASLRVLDLSANSLTEFPSVNGLGNLEKLNLCVNQIHRSDMRPFSGTPILNKLSLDSNGLEELTRENCQGLDTLTHLSLRFNSLKKVPVGCFRETPNLKVLDLSANPLGEIQGKPFKWNGNITSLQLAGCQLTKLDEGIFSSLTRLTSLSLSDNLFHAVPTETLCQLPALQTLDLYSNPLDVIKGHVFECLRELRLLKIGNSPSLSRVEACAFTGLSSLENLHVVNSGLRILDAEAFTCGEEWNMPNLKMVQLQNNGLVTLDKGLLQWKSLTVMLQDNPWRCDCNLAWIEHERINSLKGAKCASPPIAAGKSVHVTSANCQQTPNVTESAPVDKGKGKRTSGQVAGIAIWGPFVAISLVAILAVVGGFINRWNVDREQIKYHEFTRLQEF